MDILILAKIQEIRIRAQAVQTWVDGMKAENSTRTAQGESLAYGVDHFSEASRTLNLLSDEIASLIRGIRR